MKTNMLAVLALGLGAAGLAACGGGKNESADEEAAVETETPAALSEPAAGADTAAATVDEYEVDAVDEFSGTEEEISDDAAEGEMMHGADEASGDTTSDMVDDMPYGDEDVSEETTGEDDYESEQPVDDPV